MSSEKGLGDNVYEHLDLIEDPQSSYVYSYLHMIKATKKDKLISNSTITYNDILASIRNNSLTRNSSLAKSCLPTRSSPIPKVSDYIETILNASDPVSLMLSHTLMTLKFTTLISSACLLDLDEEINK
ncbi:1919_t:CDS:2 [Funneliformis caledonium]|uniref:1919_t:CDS:1 n=1 Tax=Funneliformis caledonium TaxID=1117310 RepID=A0A9N9EKL3_9GLOM|nr:1919_t:CDS:2 [Funneliformis caledonium]